MVKHTQLFAFRFSLGFQLLSLVVILVLLTGGIQAITTINLSRDSIRQDNFKSNLSHAELAANFTFEYMASVQGDIRELADHPDLTAAILNDTPETLQPLLAQSLAVQSTLENLSVFDAKGIQTADSIKNAADIGQSFSDRDWFQKVISTGLPYLGVPVVSPLTGEPTIPYSVPILGIDGQVVGVLTGIISLSRLSEMIVNVDYGNSARTALVDARGGGVIIAHPDPTRIMTPVSGNNEATARLLAGESGAIETKNSSGEMVITGYATVPGLPWGVIVVTPSAAAFSLLKTLTQNSVMATALIILSASILTCLLVIGITRPLRRLQNAAVEIGKGNLDYDVNITNKGEIGRLARSIAAMAGQLKENLVSRDKLEQEITIRGNAEAALWQTRQNYETFFNTIDEFLFVLDEHGDIIHTNSTVIERLVYTEPELAGQPVLMVHPPERREESAGIIDGMLNGTTRHGSVPVVTKSGMQIPVETRVSHGTWDGKPVIFWVSKDISQIKLSEEKFSKVFYLNPSASGLSDIVTGKYIEVNEAFHTLLGFSPDEVIGKSAAELGILKPEDNQALRLKMSPDGTMSNIEAELRAKNGDIKSVLLSAENITVQDKRYRYTVVHDITGRKKAEEAIKQSQDRLARAEKVANFGNWELDLSKAIMTASEGAQDIYGLHGEALSLQDVQNCRLPEYREMLDKALNALVKSNEPFDVEYKIRREADGIILDIRSKAEFDSGRNVVFGVIHDVTANKQAEEARRKSEGKYRSLIEQSADGIILCDGNGIVTEWNRAQTGISGISGDHAIGRPLWEMQFLLLPDNAKTPELSTSIRNGIYKLLYGGSTWSGQSSERQIQLPEGGTKTVQESSFVIQTSDRKMLGMIMRDITPQKEAQEAIRLSGQRFQALFEQSNDAIFIHDDKGHMLDVNRQAMAMLGYSREELIAMPTISYHPPDFVADAEIAFDTLSRTGSVRFDSRFRKKDGTEIDVELSVRKIGSPDDIFQAVVRDISDRKGAERKIKASLAEKGIILKEIHHRVKNNMQVISSLLQLQSGFIKNEEDAVMFMESQRRIHSMALVYNKLYQSADLANISFNEYVRDLVNSLVKAYNSGTETITTLIDVTDIELGLDFAVPCGLIINEVITNSLKYAFPPGQTGQIHVIMRKIEDHIEMALGDNGVGLPEGLTIGSTNSLGMVLIKTLVENQLGGILELNRTNGTEYRFSFPFN